MGAEETDVVDRPITERRRSIYHVKSVNFKIDSKEDYSKTTDERNLMSKALQSNEFLTNILTETRRNHLINRMIPLTVKKGEIIINQNEIGEFMYVSETGAYQVLKNNVEVHRFEDSIVFGEVAVIYNHKRHATVRALSNCKLWALHTDDYSEIMVNSAIEHQNEVLDFIKKVPVLREAPENKLQQAVGLFTKKTFTSGTRIVEEGKEGKDFYIIKAGTAKVYKESTPNCLGTLKRGNYFGEQALLKDHGVRQATVEAESTIVECLVLHYIYFIKLFGGIKEFLKVAAGDVETDCIDAPKESIAIIELHELKLRATIGEGGYGRVELCYLKTDEKRLFALKYIKRVRLVTNDLTKYVQREKEIQLQCQNQFIVKLYQTYNDRRYLYLLQEYCPGGDLLNLLQRSRAHYCKENEARFLLACVLEAIGYLHEKNFIFRDIKPENLVLDRKGYAKLTDFGCARNLPAGFRTYSMHGAPEYIPPEFIYQRGYDRAVDLWACGVLLFELLVGKTPFKTNDPSYMQTYNLIVKGIDFIKFPSRISKHATNLVKRLCSAIPHERIGYCAGIQEIRNHRWYQGFDWDKLRNYQLTSPFPIKLSYDMDTKHFDSFKPDGDLAPIDNTEMLNDF